MKQTRIVEKDAQIKALLTGKAYEYATAALGVSHMARSSYSDAFTVTRSDIDAYVAEHGVPMDKVITCDSNGEGLHFIRRENSWSLYWQELGVHYDEQSFNNEDRAKNALVEWLLRISGAGSLFS